MVVNGLLLVAIGVGIRNDALEDWSVPLGVLAGVSIVVASVLAEVMEKADDSGQKAWSGVAGFDFDDMLYLFAPFAWLGWFPYILIGAAVVSPVLMVLTAWRWWGARKAATAPQ